MEINPEEPIEFPISDEIDLHTFSPSETRSAVNEYLYECQKRGIYEVRIIHGKGKGIQKNIIRTLLNEHPLVITFRDAPPISGGWGATIVELKRKDMEE
ncbi:DNA mismatch repair protein MutS [candidate division KSB1 bacterium]|nr:MAG: DNA mismatch repair protein MutS [candidate division KSB1 bacterium]